MSKGKWKFTLREVTRLIKAAVAAGIEPRLEFWPDGRILLMPSNARDNVEAQDASVVALGRIAKMRSAGV